MDTKAATGRQWGSSGRTVLTARSLSAKISLRGETPLEILVEAMRYYHAIYASKRTKLSSQARSEALDRAAELAKDAAPYMHPRLTAVAVATHDAAPAAVDTTSLEFARRLAFLLARADASQSAPPGMVIEHEAIAR